MIKTKFLFFLLGLTLCGSRAVYAQQTSVAEQKIRKLEKHWTILLEKGDTTALKKIWTKQYVVNNANQKISTRKQILDVLKSGRVFPKIQRDIESITFNGPIAVVMGAETEFRSTENSGEAATLKRRFTNIWIKQEQEWKLAARQATTVCLEN